MEFLGKVKEILTARKFLFCLEMHTGGFFTNSYNFSLGFLLLLISTFSPAFVMEQTNIIVYAISFFVYAILIVTSVLALKGLEDGNRFRIALGFIATSAWTLIFFALFVIVCIAIAQSQLYPITLVFILLILFLFHTYLLVNMILMYKFSG